MTSTLPRKRSRRLLLLPLLASVAALTFRCEARRSGEQPNIIFALIDDAGFFDFQDRDPAMRTPNTVKLLSKGLFLSQSYAHPACAPSRSALLSGRHPHTWGAQVPSVMGAGSIHYPKEKFEYLGDVMRKQGYATHALGKWHLGFCHPSLTPLGRGFDTFYGMLAGSHGTHFYHNKKGKYYDWWDDDTIDKTANGTYSTTLLNNRMVRIIEESSAKKPFFAYLSYQAAHKPWEIEDKYLKICEHVEDKKRQVHCAIMYVIDVGIGQILEALKEKGIENNTAIVVMSDNGGPGPAGGSYNYPLRSKKGSLHEGGVRVYTALSAPQLSKTGVTWPGLIQAVDWMPTMVGIAGGETEDWMHGMNLWPDIKAFRNSSREEVFYHYDDRKEPTTEYFKRAYRYGPWKIMEGRSGSAPRWYVPPGEKEIKPVKSKKKDLGPGVFQLFNLDEDISETKDLAEDQPQKLKEIKKKMLDFLKRYKLQPYKKPETGQFKNKKELTLNTCFCHPPWAEDTPECPSR